MTIRERIQRHHGTLVFSLSLAGLILIVANVVKRDVVSLAWLARNKDALAALNSIVTMTIVVVGAVFSYFRFFRGRTLALRAELSIEVSVHSASELCHLHGISLRVKNIGNVTIWNPHPTVRVQCHGPHHAEAKGEVVEFVGLTAAVTVIEPGETITFFTSRSVDVRIWAAMYHGSLVADEGDRWHTHCVVSNSVRI